MKPLQIGDRVKLSPAGLKMKEPDSIGMKVNPIWKTTQGTITGQPASQKEPHLFTVKWDHIKSKKVFHEKFIELV